MKLVECTTDDASPSWTTFKISPEGREATHLQRLIEDCVPGGSRDSGVVDGILHLTIPTGQIESVITRLDGSTASELHEVANLIVEAMKA